MILSGVFDRHPGLEVVCAEFDVGWVANLVQQVDYWFGRASTYDAEKNINELPPSEYFKRNASSPTKTTAPACSPPPFTAKTISSGLATIRTA